jgi:hypothetical protein
MLEEFATHYSCFVVGIVIEIDRTLLENAATFHPAVQ